MLERITFANPWIVEYMPHITDAFLAYYCLHFEDILSDKLIESGFEFQCTLFDTMLCKINELMNALRIHMFLSRFFMA